MFEKFMKSKSNQDKLINKIHELEAHAKRQSEIIQHLQSQVSGGFSADFKDFPGLALKTSFSISNAKELKLEFASSGAIKYLKATPQMLRESPPLALDALTQEHRTRLIRKLVLSTHNLQPFSLEVSCRSDVGTHWLNVIVNTSVMSGRVYWQFIALDITEIKRSKALALESNETKLLFMSKLSHTLRNPLNTIMGYAQLLRSSTEGETAAENDIEVILQGCERMDMILNDLFDITNLELGVFELNEKNFSLRNLLDSLTSSYAKQAEDKGIALVYDANVPLIQVRSDEQRIKQALANLLTISIKRSPVGAVNFSCSSELRESSLHSTISILDSGEIVNAAAIERIFDGRHSLLNADQHNTNALVTNSESELRVVKKIIEKLGGTFGITSTTAQGTIFQVRISLPLSGVDPNAIKQIHTEKQVALKILVVDDSITNRRILSTFLEQRGHSVSESANGVDAVKMAQEIIPDVIFMDLDMPGLSGLNASVAIRNLDCVAREAFIVATTGQVFERDKRDAKEAGMDDFLAKPYNFSKVNDILSHFSYV